MMRPRTLFAFGLAVLLAACGSVPRERHYALSAAPVRPATAVPPSSFSIAVGPVTVPETVDQPQIVLQVAPNRVAIEEFHRWAGPLRSEIARVIAANLSQELNASRVWSYSQAALGKADYQVLVDIQRFDSTPSEAVVIDALWTIRVPGGPGKTGRSTVREPLTASGFDAIVAAHGRALGQVSRDIADAIRKP
jgi:hypothetical protein